MSDIPQKLHEKSAYPAIKEREPAPPMTVKRALAKATAVAVILAGPLASTSENSQPHDRLERASPVVERFIPRDSLGNVVAIDPDMVLRAPHEPRLKRFDYSVDVRSLDIYEQKPTWCATPTELLEPTVDDEVLRRAAAVETALTESAYEAFSKKVLEAESKQEAQAHVVSLLKAYGVIAKFDEIEQAGMYRVERHTRKLHDEHAVQQLYAQRLVSQLQSLVYVPKEMVTSVSSINFIDADVLYRKEKDGKKHLGGTYFSKEKEVMAKLDIGPWGLVHELAHTLHNKACNNYSDTELEIVYNKALANLRNLPAFQDKAMIDDINNISSDAHWYSAKYRQATGFPTDYSKTRYVELMGDLTTAMLRYGQTTFSNKDSVVAIEARQLDQLVLERMKAAMPTVDVAAFVAAKERFPVDTEIDLPLADMITKHVSPLDESYTAQDLREAREARTIIRPAIKIINSDGREEYVHSIEDDVNIKAPGSERYFKISYKPSGNPSFDAQLLEKSQRYIQKLQLERGLGDKVDVRDLGTGKVIVIGAPERLPVRVSTTGTMRD